MQRQSLGSSPTSKLHIHEENENSVAEGQKHRDNIDGNDCKDTKPRRLSFSPSSYLTSPEKLIHLIPLLTFICFLILYLTSYSPSQSDLDYFNGFKHPSQLLDSSEISVFEKGDIWTIRSRRNLQQLAKHIPMSRPNRKLAHF